MEKNPSPKNVPSLVNLCYTTLAKHYVKNSTELDDKLREGCNKLESLPIELQDELKKELILEAKKSLTLLGTIPIEKIGYPNFTVGIFSPDGNKIVIHNKGLHIYDAYSGKKIVTLNNSKKNIHTAKWSPLGNYITSIERIESSPFQKVFWNLQGKYLYAIKTAGNNIKWTHDEKYLIHKRLGKPYTLNNAQNGEVIPFTLSGHYFEHSVAQDPQAKLLNISIEDKSVLYDINTFKCIRSFDDRIIQFSPDGSILVGKSRDYLTYDAYCVTIYNRSFELIKKIYASKDSRPCINNTNTAIMIHSSHRQSIHSLIKNDDEKVLYHWTNKKKFNSLDCSLKIVLNTENYKTHVTISSLNNSTILHKHKFNEQLDDICYCADHKYILLVQSHLIDLREFSVAKYIFNLETGLATHINLPLNSCSKWKKRIRYAAFKDNKYLTFNKDNNLEIRYLWETDLASNTFLKLFEEMAKIKNQKA